MDSKAEVRIVGDASSGIDATERFADATSKAAAQVKAKMAEIQTASRTAFSGLGREANDAARDVSSATARISSAAERVKSAGSGISSIWKGVAAIWAGSELVDWGKQLFGVAQRGLEFASSLGETAQQLGVSSAAMQEYRYVASQVGISNDEMDAGLQRLTRAIGLTDQGNKKTTAAFRELHVAIRDTNGQIRPTEDVLYDLIKAFSAIKDPAQRAALQVALFGKAGQQLDTLLAGGISQVDNLREAAHRLGIVLDEDQIRNADDTADKLASIKRVLEANIAGVVSNNAAAIVTLANALGAVAQSAIQAAGAYATWLSVSSVRSGGEQGDAAARGLLGSKQGRVAAYAEAQRVIATGGSSPFGSKNDILPRITTSAERQANVAEAQRILGAVTRAEVAARRIDARRPNPNAVRPETEGGALPSVSGGKPKKQKGGGGSGGTNRVQGWEEKLEDQRLAFAKMQDQQGTFQEFSQSSEASYWKRILDTQTLTEREKLQVTRNYLRAATSVRKDDFEARIAQYHLELDEAGENGRERVRLTELIANEIGAKYGRESREYREAQADIVRAKREAAQQIREIEEEQARETEAAQLDAIDSEQDESEFRVQLGLSTNRKLLQQQLDFEQRRMQVKRAAIQAELAITNPNTQALQYARLLNQLAALDRRYAQQKANLERQLALQSRQRQLQAIGSLSQSWGQALARMVTLQASFGETVRSLWQGLVGAITQALADMIADYLKRWLLSLIIKKAAGKAAAAGELATQVALAGAGGTASMAAAPFPLNLGAPEFGAAMAAAAAAYAPAASFAVGSWELPSDMVARVHKGEMIVPRTFADDLRENGGLGGGGDTFNITALDARSFARFLKDHHAAVGDAVRHHARQGGAMAI